MERSGVGGERTGVRAVAGAAPAGVAAWAAARGVHYGWVVVAITFVTVVTAAGVRSAPSVLIRPLESEFGWHRGEISLALSLSLLMYGLGAPLSGRLADRFGIRARYDARDRTRVRLPAQICGELPYQRRVFGKPQARALWDQLLCQRVGEPAMLVIVALGGAGEVHRVMTEIGDSGGCAGECMPSGTGGGIGAVERDAQVRQGFADVVKQGALAALDEEGRGVKGPASDLAVALGHEGAAARPGELGDQLDRAHGSVRCLSGPGPSTG